MNTELVGPQLNGQTHMNMIGLTRLEMFDLMDWADKNIENRSRNSTQAGQGTTAEPSEVALLLRAALRGVHLFCWSIAPTAHGDVALEQDIAKQRNFMKDAKGD